MLYIIFIRETSRRGKKEKKSWYQYIFLGERTAGIQAMRSQVRRDSEGASGPPVSCLELELEGELDGAGAADLVEGVEARHWHRRSPGCSPAFTSSGQT